MAKDIHEICPPHQSTAAESVEPAEGVEAVADVSIEVASPPNPIQELPRAKLDPPTSPLELVSRPHLLARLDASARYCLTLIAAPAGFGKTTLLAQWRRQRLQAGDSIGWLTLDEAERDEHQFLAYLVVALGVAGLDISRLGYSLGRGTTRSDLERSTMALLEAIGEHPCAVRLILDDYHRAESVGVNRVFSLLLAKAPRNFSVFVNCRICPQVDIARLIASGVATEIDADHLRFSAEETRQAIDSPINEVSFAQLYERTAGWPVAVQLARVLLAAHPGEQSLIERVTGRAGHLAAYLTEQILLTLPADLQDFLVRTSILERFNIELANAVTLQVDGASHVRQLEPLSALVVPSSEDQDWFSCHHLFAECLQDHLARRFPDEIDVLHARASNWFADRGNVMEAVKHARAARDYKRCSVLIEQAGGWQLITFGGIGYLRNLLQNIPREHLSEFPRILLAKAYLEAKDGHVRETRALFDAAHAQRGEHGSHPALERDLLCVGSLLADYEDPPVTLRHVERLNEQLSRLPATDAIGAGILQCQRVLNLIALGRLSEADAALDLMTRAMHQANSVLGINYCFLHRALIAMYQGRFTAADAHIAVARRMSDTNYGADSGLRFLSDAIGGALRCWQGRLLSGEKERFLTAVSEVESNDGWCEIYANVLDIEADIEPGAAIARAKRLVQARGLRRLELLVLSYELRAAYRDGCEVEAELLAQRLRQCLPDNIWRSDPFLWRPFVESRLALASGLVTRNRALALKFLDDAHECCSRAEGVIFRIDVLVCRAQVLHLSGDRAGALATLCNALYLASPEHVCRPFLRARRIVSLLRVLRRERAGVHLDIVVLDFIGEILDQAPETRSDVEGGLTQRELEVLSELSEGSANKEIARVLEMTEHTVKFHIKNIFTKLQVKQRAEAVDKARAQRLI